MSSSRPARGRAARPRLLLLLLAALSLLSSVAFVLAPVERPEAVYSWPSAPGDATAVAIPLMVGRPAQMTASIDCAVARDAEPGTVLLSTTPLEGLPGADPLPGLRVEVDDDSLRIRTGETDLQPQPLPGDDCVWELVSAEASTVLLLDGDTVEERAGDLRPTVAGVFTEVADADGLSVEVIADTVFQTSPTWIKIAAAVVAVLSLAGALVLLLVVDRRPGRGDGGTNSSSGGAAGATASVAAPAGAARRRSPVRLLVDAAVALLLAGWAVIGPLTVDDGYIAGIIRSREANGYVGNVYRWFNAPEAPFGWFYEVFVGWSQLSTSTTWMRLPAAVLGIATWLLVGRGLLPRLGAFGRHPGMYVVTALVFALWWLPSNVGLRPEAWVAAGLATAVVLVERGLSRERLLPLALAAVVGAATLAVTPTGVVALLPLLVAVVPILRLARRSPVGLFAAVAVALAGAASGLLLMFADQSLAGVLFANRLRNELPGAVSWVTEIQRWYDLLSTGAQQGSLSRRMPVLLTLVALAGLVWQRMTARLPDDVARGPVDRLLATYALSLVVLLFTPTKWTMHFGAFAPVGTALLVVAVHAFGRRRSGSDVDVPGEPAATGAGSLGATVAALSAVLLVAAQSWAGWNQWAYVSNYDIPYRESSPQLFEISFSAVFITLAVGIAVVGAGALVVARVRGDADAQVAAPGWLPSAGAVAVLVTLGTVALLVLSFLKSTWDRRDAYSLGSDAAATLDGRPCGLAEELLVEEDPRAGLLPAFSSQPDDEESRLDGFIEIADGDTEAGADLSMAGQDLPGWSATGHVDVSGDGPASLVTGWFELPASLREEGLPVVVTLSGTRGTGTNVVAEFGTIDGGTVTAIGATGVPESGGAPGARDARVDPSAVPPEAAVVRLVATDGGSTDDLPISVSVPRVPVLAPFDSVVNPGTPALVDWPVAFVFPCQTLGVQDNGVTDIPRWRIAPPPGNDAGDIIVEAFVGGPYSPARTLVDEADVPVYAQSRPLERLLTLYSWTPRLDLAEPQRRITSTTVAGWAH